MSAFFLDLHSTADAISAPPVLDSDGMDSSLADCGRPPREPSVLQRPWLLEPSQAGLGVTLEEDLIMLIRDCEEKAELPVLETPCNGQDINLPTLLRQKERDLVLAAKLGKALLERNQDLTKQYERVQKEYHDKLEHLEQERHGLRLRLASREGEWEGRVAELETDLRQLQEEQERQQARLRQQDREKNRAATDLAEQNTRLLEQLTRATEAERLLSTQVQALREDFRKRSISTNQHMSRLDSLQAEIKVLSERKRDLERRTNGVLAENELMQTTIDGLHERTLVLERQCYEKDLLLRQSQLDLQEVRMSHHQLGSHLEELSQERDMEELDSHNHSLLFEMEQEEDRERLRLQLWEVHCQLRLLCSRLRSANASNPEMPNESSTDDGSSQGSPAKDSPAGGLRASLLELRGLTQYLLDSNESMASQRCDQEVLEDQVRKLGEELHGARELCKIEQEQARGSQEEALQLRNQVAMLSVELCSAREESERLKSLAEVQEPGVRLQNAIQDRDDAITKKNAMEMELAKCKIDIMSLNSQLLDAIHQKLNLSQQLEAWQDDMLRMIDQQLMDKHQEECRVTPYSFSGGHGKREVPQGRPATRPHRHGDKRIFSFFKKN